VLAWLIWRRDGRTVPVQRDIVDGTADFDFREMLAVAGQRRRPRRLDPTGPGPGCTDGQGPLHRDLRRTPPHPPVEIRKLSVLRTSEALIDYLEDPGGD
jgi:hypothetical protein